MKLRKYWKDIQHAFTSSMGRSISIIFMLALGAMTFIGLKVTGPNMEKTAQQYIHKTNMFDLAVMSNYGLSSNDVQELKSAIKSSKVESGYLQDAEIKNTNKSIRIFSKNKVVSKDNLTKGRMPVKNNEIALSYTMEKEYKLGDTITFEYGANNILKNKTYTVVGFIKSADIWSDTTMGNSSSGTGELNGYAVTVAGAFNSDVYSIARIAYDDLDKYPYNSSEYKNGVKEKQKILTEILKKRERHRKKELIESIGGETNSQKVLADPKYDIYIRSTLPGGDGYNTYDSSTASISAIGNIFPVVLYIVAALVTSTTMTRFVDEERTKAGLFRSLGYTKRQVLSKFVIYSLVTSILGTVIGGVIGYFGLSQIIGDIVTKGMVVGRSNLYFYPSYILIIMVAALLSAVYPAYLVSRKELSEEPSQLLLPKPPSAGATIWLERLSFIWRHLSFTRKVTARNIFRYKQRMLMTILGVGGSVALFFTGIGLQSSIHGVTDRQFTQILQYDIIISKNPLSTQEDQKQLSDYLNVKADSVKDIEIEQLKLKISGVDNEQSANLFISSDNNFNGYINLQSRRNKSKLKLSNEGAILSEKLANLYNVKEGDTVQLRLDGKQVKIKIDGITEMYAGHTIYMTKEYYQNLTGSKYQTNAQLVKLKNRSSSNIQDISAELLKMSGISSVSQNTALIKMMTRFSSSMQSVTFILIILSMLLAVVILYNLTSINVAERLRELSTIKVLGFHSYEVTLYIYRETITLSIFGVILGLSGGYFLHQEILKMIVADEIMFNPNVGTYVYIVPILSLSLLLLVLGGLVYRTLKRIDMLEALKSID